MARLLIVVALGLVTAVFLWPQWRDWRTGQGASPVKLVLLVSSIAFWWYCNNGVQNILVGIALFEVFHDVQYLAIVWIYNRSRVERDNSIGGFMRFIFRRSGALIGVYVGLVLAYGSIALTTSGVSAEWIRHALIGVVTASALLHFYYDGFIWKVRETQTRKMLGIEGAGAAQLLGRVVPPLERTAKVAEVLPQDAQAQLNYGKALHAAGRVEEAIPKYEFALNRKPSLAEAEFLSGLAWQDLEEWDKALVHYERALNLEPRSAKTQVNLAGILMKKARTEEARRLYESALKQNPELDIAHKNLGDILSDAGEYEAAIQHYSEALRINPNFKAAKDNLAFARSLVKH